MTIELLGVAEASARGLLGPDVYYSPAYGAATEHSDGARWEVAVYDGGRALMPYLRRPVDPALGGEDLFDAVSPYGYAGPWAAEPLGQAGRDAFRASLVARWREAGCVAEFHRLSALLPGAELALSLPGLEVLSLSSTVVLDLTLGHEALWARAEGRSRTSVRKARKLGYAASFRAATAADLGATSPFRRLYEDTMRGVGAGSYYLFPEAYYQALRAVPGLFVCEVTDSEGVVSAAALFLQWGELSHYHLSGSARQAARDGANNLMIDEAMRGLMARGAHRLHLGGGVKPGDSLFRFKQGFGGESLPFRVARSVVDAPACAALVSARAEQLATTPEALTATGYFPPYRAG